MAPSGGGNEKWNSAKLRLRLPGSQDDGRLDCEWPLTIHVAAATVAVPSSSLALAQAKASAHMNQARGERRCWPNEAELSVEWSKLNDSDGAGRRHLPRGAERKATASGDCRGRCLAARVLSKSPVYAALKQSNDLLQTACIGNCILHCSCRPLRDERWRGRRALRTQCYSLPRAALR